MTVYLQVGVGSFTGDYIDGGKPQNNTTVNTVSATLSANAVGSGTAQAMTTNSTAAQSFWDGYTYCSVPSQLYIGGFYRTTGAATTAAQVTATVPAALTDTTGDSIPFSKIQWTSGGNGDTGAEGPPRDDQGIRLYAEATGVGVRRVGRCVALGFGCLPHT